MNQCLRKNNKKVKKSAEPIKSKREYLSLFDDKKLDKALEAALDIRKFEIELYWKRTAFFWAFIVSTYTGLFTLLIKYTEDYSRYVFLGPVISTLAGLGFFFSVAWHMVNKGSKFWQKNWELHVSLLENSEIGPLYDVYLNPRQKLKNRLCPVSGFDFSVSKINMWASCMISVLSCFGWITVVVWAWKSDISKKQIIVPNIIIILFLLALIFLSDGNSDIKIETNPKEKSSSAGNNDIDMIHIQ